MNILVFSTHDHIPPTGGAELAFANIAKRIAGHRFTMICARLSKDVKRFEVVDDVCIYRIGVGIPKIDVFLLALFGHIIAKRLMRKERFDLMWSIMASYGAFSAIRLKRSHNIPFLLTLQEGDPIEYILKKVRFVRRQFNRIFTSADAIQAISSYLKRWGDDMGFQGKENVVIPNGVDVSLYLKEISSDDIQKTRHSFGFPKKSTILITTSRLEVKNGIGDVIDALSLLPSSVCFVICGHGSLERALREKATRLGLEKRVLFLGSQPPEKLPLLLKSSDIFIRPSLSEGLGNSFLEAMAAGTLTIGTNVGGIPDFLHDNVTGKIVKKECPHDIARVLTEIASMKKEKREDIKKNAKELVKTDYNWDKIAIDMNNLFLRTIEK